MSGSLRTLHQQRRAAMGAVLQRHRVIQNRRAQVVQRLDQYLGTPQSLLQAFLVGFFVDQARPGVAAGFWLMTYPLVAGKRWLAGSIFRVLSGVPLLLQRLNR